MNSGLTVAHHYIQVGNIGRLQSALWTLYWAIICDLSDIFDLKKIYHWTVNAKLGDYNKLSKSYLKYILV